MMATGKMNMSRIIRSARLYDFFFKIAVPLKLLCILYPWARYICSCWLNSFSLFTSMLMFIAKLDSSLKLCYTHVIYYNDECIKICRFKLKREKIGDGFSAYMAGRCSIRQLRSGPCGRVLFYLFFCWVSRQWKVPHEVCSLSPVFL